MRILILGGAVFLGRHLVDAALNAGHQATTFRRGRERADFPKGVATIFGDRRGNHAESQQTLRIAKLPVPCRAIAPYEAFFIKRQLTGDAPFLAIQDAAVNFSASNIFFVIYQL